MPSMASTILNEHGWEREPELIEVALAEGDKDEMRSAYNRADYKPYADTFRRHQSAVP